MFFNAIVISKLKTYREKVQTNERKKRTDNGGEMGFNVGLYIYKNKED